MTETANLTRTAALDKLDALREELPHAQQNALAGVVRNLWDNYPLADAVSALKAVSDRLPYEVTESVRALLAAIAE